MRKNIGVVGTCASEGYAPFAAKTNLRIKACATSAAVCVGTMARRGFDKDSTTPDILRAQLKSAAKDCNSVVPSHEKVDVIHMLPATLEAASALPKSFQNLANYYRKRQPHPRTPTYGNTCLPKSPGIIATFATFAYIEMISPRPLLMITGTKAATQRHSEVAVEKAKDPEELFLTEGLTHAGLYDHIDQAGPKLIEFFGRYLQ